MRKLMACLALLCCVLPACQPPQQRATLDQIVQLPAASSWVAVHRADTWALAIDQTKVRRVRDMLDVWSSIRYTPPVTFSTGNGQKTGYAVASRTTRDLIDCRRSQSAIEEYVSYDASGTAVDTYKFPTPKMVQTTPGTIADMQVRVICSYIAEHLDIVR